MPSCNYIASVCSKATGGAYSRQHINEVMHRRRVCSASLAAQLVALGVIKGRTRNGLVRLH